MSSREFAEWQAFARLQPFGARREDERAGTIAAAIVNVYKKKSAKPFSWRKFFPAYVDQSPGSRWQALLSKVLGINAALGGEDTRL